MKGIRIGLLRTFLTIVYAAIKLVTRVDERKVVFLGRRMNRLPLDFRLIIEELQHRNPEVRVVVYSKLVRGEDMRETLSFVPTLLKSLYHLATAKVCVLDSYWPAVSMLTHRRSLVIYQIWHSIGKIKQSGKQALGRTQGRAEHVANGMRMHEGYDYVVAGAKVWNPQYRAAFGVEDDRLLNIGLPRADYLIREKDVIAERITSRYPELKQKPVLLYVPTFRRGENATGALKLATAVDLEQFTLVVKKHESDTLVLPPQHHLTCPEFTGTELLTVADYVITDYSSIALEAALIDVKTFYFLYDYEHYLESNGVNIDLDNEVPGCVFRDADSLVGAIESEYPLASLRRYQEKFLFPDPGHSTKDLVDHIFTAGGLCTR
ncbi:CDP-glycerol glycerophosphotransferase family protein [Microbacterium esteraromaticum]|uniref:CDP-glycerol glycerophosphotransferase family protein n=1 Tax=Microbacterium esteraromaticum TaxID=57043 RepID=UPI0019D3386C|nr:CDP-glycerol glycerophosphotransferase family protein [Microbacterium esteraromaticum]MBN7794139.1 CDP-glycerol glycerophosphotransferase family protein [Microbacterium esteraromaticum]